MSRPNDKRNKDIIRRRRKGQRNKDIAEFYKITEATVSRIYYRDKHRF